MGCVPFPTLVISEVAYHCTLASRLEKSKLSYFELFLI
jgi:hypothetical protein